MNWTAIFKSFFESRRNEIDRILDAQGCREGWLQGEMFLHSPPGSIQTNSTPQKFDLVSKIQIHPMLAEIKICGGDYQEKMKKLIEADIIKLTAVKSGPAKYMILLIDTRRLETSLGRWLNDFQVDSEEKEEVLGKYFKARIWKMKKTEPHVPT